MVKKLSANKRKKRMPVEQRQEVLLNVAAEVFLEKGYNATSLDEIISRAGGSRRNIYTQFGGKEGLFKNLIMEIAEQALQSMRQNLDKERDLCDSLFDFANRLLSALFMPSVLNLTRLALSEGIRFPELSRIYFENGPNSAAENLVLLLEAAKNRGEIMCIDSNIAASQFVGMLRDNIYLQVLLRLRPAPKQGERQILIESAVSIFLNGIRTNSVG